MVKKYLLFLVAVMSVLVGLDSMSTDDMIYGIFYIVLGLIIAGYAVVTVKEQKTLLIVSGFIALFIAMGVHEVIINNALYGIVFLIIALAFVFKERTSYSKQLKNLLG